MRAPRSRDEPGCRRFDVVEPQGEPDRVLLYEIYDDEAAFDAHAAPRITLAFDARERAAGGRESMSSAATLVCEG